MSASPMNPPLSRRRWLAACSAAVALAGCAPLHGGPAADPLPSWNEGPNKQRIVEFVKTVTTEGSKDYVAPAERIAVFDNDGTLWVEQPMYSFVMYALERVPELAKAALKNVEPRASALGIDNLFGIDLWKDSFTVSYL